MPSVADLARIYAAAYACGQPYDSIYERSTKAKHAVESFIELMRKHR